MTTQIDDLQDDTRDDDSATDLAAVFEGSAMEQIAGQFTLGELAAKIGIDLTTLIERTVVRPMGIEHDLPAVDLHAALVSSDPAMLDDEDKPRSVAEALYERSFPGMRRTHRKGWEAYKTGLALQAAATDVAAKTAAKTAAKSKAQPAAKAPTEAAPKAAPKARAKSKAPASKKAVKKAAKAKKAAKKPARGKARR